MAVDIYRNHAAHNRTMNERLYAVIRKLPLELRGEDACPDDECRLALLLALRNTVTPQYL
jgi:hypothetical protein